MTQLTSLRRLLFVSAYEVYRGTPVGNPSPRTRELGERLSKPRVGDLAMEISTFWMLDRDEHRFGRLIHMGYEPFYTREEWVRDGGGKDEPIPSRIVYYLEKEDGSEYCWDNASFVVVLEEPWK